MSVEAFSPQRARPTDTGWQAGSTQTSHLGAAPDRPVAHKSVTPPNYREPPSMSPVALRHAGEEMYSARYIIPPTAILTGHLTMSTGPRERESARESGPWRSRMEAPIPVSPLLVHRRIYQWIHVWYTGMARVLQAVFVFLSITFLTDKLEVVMIVISCAQPTGQTLQVCFPPLLSSCFLTRECCLLFNVCV